VVRLAKLAKLVLAAAIAEPVSVEQVDAVGQYEWLTAVVFIIYITPGLNENIALCHF
jgi:hypothetical protein